MGAIKLTSQSRLQTRKRGAREAGTALVTLVTILVQLSPRAAERRVPSPVRDADISLCRQPYLCPASGTSPCLAVLTSPWAQGEHKGDRKHWRPGSPRGNASAQRTQALADALMGRTQHSWSPCAWKGSSGQSQVFCPSASGRTAAGQASGTSVQEMLLVRPSLCRLHGWLLGFSLGFFCCFPRPGLLAALLGPQQLRGVDMFTSKELLLIKHQ